MLNTLVVFGLLDRENFLRALLVPRLHDTSKLASTQLRYLDEARLKTTRLLLAERDRATRAQETSLGEGVSRSRLSEESMSGFLLG